MSFPKNVWNQIKNITAGELIKALERDGWSREEKSGAVQAFGDGNGKRVTVHLHPKKTYGAKLLQGLLGDIGWTEQDMKRLKLIK